MNRVAYCLKHHCWVTKDLNIIKISDMTEAHLRNTIRLIERKLSEYKDLLPYMYYILGKNIHLTHNIKD